MGLQYQGFGYWTDPKTGQITHQTQGGELKPYSGGKAELAGAQTQPDPLKDKPGMQDDPTGPRQAPGTGILGAPEPGTEQHPRGGNWNPGPNGDNCVNDQRPPEDLAYDTFVGKTNFYKWTAGAEGSNYKNIQVKDLLTKPVASREHIEHSFFTFLAEKGNMTPAGLGGLTPAEKARSMGLESSGHGQWRDKSGKIVAVTVNGELQFYETGGGAVSDSDGGSQMAIAKPTFTNTVTGQAMTPPSKPETPEEIAAVTTPTPAQTPNGYDRDMNRRSYDMHKNAAVMDEISQRKAEVDNKYEKNPILKAVKIASDRFIDFANESGDEKEMAVANHLMDVLVDKADEFNDIMMAVPPDAQEGLARTFTNMAERTARLRYAMEDDDTEVTQDMDEKIQNDIEREDLVQAQQEDIEKIQKEFDLNMEKQLEELKGQKKSNREKAFEQFREKLKNIPDQATRDSYVQAVNFANTFMGRVNAGKGKTALGMADTQTLKANEGRLMAGYGSGSPEEVEKFVRSCRPIKISDEMLDASFDVLPAAFKDSLSRKGNVGTKYLKGKGHFLGYNEDGSVKRGGTGNNDRAKLAWRLCLEQGFKDAYTGLPLNLDDMDLEHVVGFNNKDNGDPNDDDWANREHEKNMVMINTNINQKKNEFSMGKFFELRVNPLEDYTEEMYDNRDRAFDEQNRIIGASEQLSKKLMKNKKLPEDVDGEALYQYFLQDELRNKEFNEKMRVGKKNNKELNEINKLESNLAYDLFKGLDGFKHNFPKAKTGRGNNSLDDHSYYKGMLMSYAALDKKGREKFLTVFGNIHKQEVEKFVEGAQSGELHSLAKARQNIVDTMRNYDLIDDEKIYNIVDEQYKTDKRTNWKTVWGTRPKSYDNTFAGRKKTKDEPVKENYIIESMSFSSFMSKLNN